MAHKDEHDTPSCGRCRHRMVRPFRSEPGAPSRCGHPAAMGVGPPVDGPQTRASRSFHLTYETCGAMRGEDGRCGPEGRLHEPMPPPKGRWSAR